MQDGTGTVVLSGNNTFTGGITLNGGTLTISAVNALNSNAVAFGSGASTTLSLNGFSTVVNGLSTGTNVGNDVVNNNSATAAQLTVSVARGVSQTYAGTLQDGAAGGAFSLVKSGNGTLVLTNAGSNYSGDVTVNRGVLVVTNAAALGTGTSPVVVYGIANRGVQGGQLVVAGSLGSGITINRNITPVSGQGPTTDSAALLLRPATTPSTATSRAILRKLTSVPPTAPPPLMGSSMQLPAQIGHSGRQRQFYHQRPDRIAGSAPVPRAWTNWAPAR